VAGAKDVAPVEPIALFAFQLSWFLFVWSLIARFLLWPRSAALEPDARLSLWIAPEMFRVLGVGLLVPNLSPGMPTSFAVPTAAADTLTAMLAALAFLGLRLGWAAARKVAWACTTVGIVDLIVAFPHAASVGAVTHLSTQWYVPVFAAPALFVCHVACLVLLVRGRGGPAPEDSVAS
jgi:hypothetical protein